jgi:hypothetical protein
MPVKLERTKQFWGGLCDQAGRAVCAEVWRERYLHICNYERGLGGRGGGGGRPGHRGCADELNGLSSLTNLGLRRELLYGLRWDISRFL